VRGEVDAIFVKGAEGVLVANLIGAQIVSEFGLTPTRVCASTMARHVR
jgi:hypothetical protein